MIPERRVRAAKGVRVVSPALVLELAPRHRLEPLLEAASFARI